MGILNKDLAQALAGMLLRLVALAIAVRHESMDDAVLHTQNLTAPASMAVAAAAPVLNYDPDLEDDEGPGSQSASLVAKASQNRTSIALNGGAQPHNCVQEGSRKV